MHDIKHELKVLMLDAATGFYRMQRYRVGDFFRPRGPGDSSILQA
jgi:hypothetical protein